MDIRNNKAFEFWKKEMGDEKHNIHCAAVIEACIGMANNTDLELEIFIVAGWIHDMGKLVDKKTHHIESLKYLNKFLNQNTEYEKWKLELKDCILNHRTNGTPKTIYGIIFKCADKVALYNKKWLEYKKSK